MYLVSMSISTFIPIMFGYVFEWLYDFTTNYALTLFLFALVVKVILLPLSAKQKKTSMKTSRLAPQLKELERECGDDKTKYQQEMMALYKEEGVSMTGGCVWSLIPLLILIPLYYVIREPLTYVRHLDSESLKLLRARFGTEVSAREAAYWQLGVIKGMYENGLPNGMNLSLWGIDLSTRPSFRIWKAKSWNEVGQFLIPVVSALFNYASMIISQKMNNQVTTDERGEQDKEAAELANKSTQSMMYMMPIMSGVFGFLMPAGLSIYWIAQAVLGIVQDVVLTKHYKKVYDAEDAVKREKAAAKAKEEEEKERIRAQRRAENPDGITSNTSKKKLEQQQKAEREAAAREYAAKQAPQSEDAVSGDPDRPYSRGRAYVADRYSKKDAPDDTTEE